MPRESARLDSLDERRRKLIQIITEARDRLGITQEEAAQRCGFSSSYFSMVETGRRIPKTDFLFRIIRSLDIPFEEVIAYVPDELKQVMGVQVVMEPSEALGMPEEALADVRRYLAALPRMPILRSLKPENVDMYGGLVLGTVGLSEENLTWLYVEALKDRKAYAVHANPDDTDNPLPKAAVLVIAPSLGMRNDTYALSVTPEGHFLRRLFYDGRFYTVESKTGRAIYTEDDLRRHRKNHTLALLPIGEVHLHFY